MIINIDSIVLQEELIPPVDNASAIKKNEVTLYPNWPNYDNMLKIGGYSVSGTFHRIYIPVLFHLYNIFNMIWVSVQLNDIWGWCLPMDLVSVIIQLTSFAGYTFTLIAMKGLTKSTSTSKQPLEYTQYVEAPSRKFSILLWTALLSVYGSGVLTIVDWKNARKNVNGAEGDFYLLNLSNILDLIRYVPIMVFTMISHQILSSFEVKLSEFDRRLVVDGVATLVPSNEFNSDHDDHSNHSNDAGIPSNEQCSGLLSIKKCQYDEITVFNNLNHKKFIESFSALIAPYRVILKEFSPFFAVIFVFNVAIWICLVWNVVWRIDTDSPCNAKVWTEYTHAGIEVVYYVDGANLEIEMQSLINQEITR